LGGKEEGGREGAAGGRFTGQKCERKDLIGQFGDYGPN